MDGKNELIFVASIFPQISRLDLSTLDCAYAEDAEGGLQRRAVVCKTLLNNDTCSTGEVGTSNFSSILFRTVLVLQPRKA
jgi:hypothetical protein